VVNRSVGNHGFTAIRGPDIDPYEEKVVYTYHDDPHAWQQVLGEYALFQWGVYDHPASPRPVSLDEAGIRFFERQLELAGLVGPERPQMARILDLGCGWGYLLYYLAETFQECSRIDGINVSERQLEHCVDLVARHGLTDRINMFLCNAQDVGSLPEPQTPYDLVVIRGVITHFSNDLYERSMAALAELIRPGGKLVISDTLYHVDPSEYRSAITDDVDRLACGHRKTPQYLVAVLESCGFAINDLRVLPKNTDVAHWLLEVRSNIERYFPGGVTGALEELRVTTVNLSIALLTEKVSAYSVIAEKA
jgi:cyclopropane fatty-acyl-phospholipid synthase-like methyltransferase